MGKVVVWVGLSNFAKMRNGESFHACSRRTDDSEIEVIVPISAVSSVNHMSYQNETIFEILPKEQW